MARPRASNPLGRWTPLHLELTGSSSFAKKDAASLSLHLWPPSFPHFAADKLRCGPSLSILSRLRCQGNLERAHTSLAPLSLRPYTRTTTPPPQLSASALHHTRNLKCGRHRFLVDTARWNFEMWRVAHVVASWKGQSGSGRGIRTIMSEFKFSNLCLYHLP